SYSKVTSTSARPTHDIFVLKYSDGTEIETTWNHPFYIQGKGWVEVKDLEAGDLSLTSRDTVLEVTSIRMKPVPQTVYNIHLAKDHTYFVTDSDVLVHNYKDGESLQETLDRKNNYPRIPEPLKGGALRQYLLPRLKDSVYLGDERPTAEQREKQKGLPVSEQRYILREKNAGGGIGGNDEGSMTFDADVVYIVDGQNRIVGANSFGHVFVEGLSNIYKEEYAIVNGQEVTDGSIIKTDFKNGRMSLVNVASVNETRAFVSTTGISNGTADQVERTLDMSTNAYSEGYDSTYHVANADGNVDAAAKTLAQLMEKGVFRDGGAIVGHSQGAIVVANALDIYQQSINADVYMYGGAQYTLGAYGTTPGQPKQKSIRTDLVRNWYNFWNQDDNWTYVRNSKQSDMYTDNSNVKDFVNGKSGQWYGSGHEFIGGYNEAYENCFQHIENCK
ncbi:MAG: hypothetical protein KDK33_15650, partial [Leptospiraceae bacterium]|nr:hypothetical protein [Leptospiraceae bacterium]